MKNFTISIFLLTVVCLISTAFIEKPNDVCVVGNSSQMIGTNNNILVSMYNSLLVGSSNDIVGSGNSILVGSSNDFSGDNAILVGIGSKMNGNNSAAFGELIDIFGNGNLGAGRNGLINGNHDFLLSGGNSSITGNGSFAAGTNVSVNGDNSFGFGNNAFINNDGCFVYNSINLPTSLPPNPPTSIFGTVTSGDNGQAIFNAPGGFYIFYDQFGFNLSLIPGNVGWTSVSNKNKKHNFNKLDPANILDKYRILDNHVTWSYKGYDIRNYGPMAQDFYKAFGEDGYGTIGTDTTISTHNIASVNLIAIHELEKRNRLQKEQLDLQAITISKLMNEVETLKETNSRIIELEEKLKQITASLEL